MSALGSQLSVHERAASEDLIIVDIVMAEITPVSRRTCWPIVANELGRRLITQISFMRLVYIYHLTEAGSEKAKINSLRQAHLLSVCQRYVLKAQDERSDRETIAN